MYVCMYVCRYTDVHVATSEVLDMCACTVCINTCMYVCMYVRMSNVCSKKANNLSA
jgi:hypothetical protein